MAANRLLSVLVLLGMQASLTKATSCSSSEDLSAGSTFTASSGNPGSPVLPGGEPWIPVVSNVDQTNWLTADVGQTARVTGFKFAGDPSKSTAPSQIKLLYSNDNVNFVAALSNRGNSYFWSTHPPPVPGTEDTSITLDNPVEGRYFRFQVIEPNAYLHEGGASLRVQLFGCHI